MFLKSWDRHCDDTDQEWRERVFEEGRKDLEVCGRFWNFVDDSGGPDSCWPWKGNTTGKGGHGVFSILGVSVLAHRLSYRICRGKIPKGKLVCHDCDNPPCCNPKHLYAGTHSDNARDAINRGRRKKSVPGNRKLTEEKVAEIREAVGKGFKQRYLAKLYGVSAGLISLAARGKAWKHVAAPVSTHRADRIARLKAGKS